MTPVPSPDSAARADAEAAAKKLLEQQGLRRRKEQRVFTDGELVARRYRVLDWIDRGGFGQVYRVADKELGTQVALKTLHPALAESPEARERFKKEVLLSRSISHENVCRVFEFGKHEAEQPVHFVTLELIDGETLAAYGSRRAPLPLEEVLELGAQLSLGLRAAHRQGIVHLDLKAQNVLLEARQSGGLRVVLSDFGLAAALPAGELETSSEAFEGTPLTMAPEQVRGGAVGPRTDLYSFGVLLYYLAVGSWPFSTPTSLGTALERLDKAVKPPHELRSELPADLSRLIMECLATSPGDRPGSAEQVLQRLRRMGKVDDSPLPRGNLRKAGGLAAIVMVGLSLGALALREPVREKPLAAAPVSSLVTLRPAVLWLGFAYSEAEESVDDAPWLRNLVEQSFVASLAAAGDVRWVAGERAAAIRRELGPSTPGSWNRRRVERLKRRAGVDDVLFGSAREDSEGRLHLKLFHGSGADSVDGGAGFAAGVVSARDLATLGDVIEAMADATRSRFDSRPPTMAQASNARAEIPQDAEAAKLYAEALEAIRKFDTRRASELLIRSLEHEPDHPQVLATLATTWQQLGFGDKARDASRRALEHAGGLSRAAQMTLEARHRLRHREWQRAQGLFRALWEFFPDEAAHGLGLLEAQDRAGELEAALTTLAELRRRTPTRQGIPDPRFDLAESMLAFHQGDPARGREAARRAGDLGRRLEAPALIAQALTQEALTRLAVDEDLAPVELMLHEAGAILRDLGDRRTEVRTRLYLADCALRADRFDAAEAAYRDVIELAEAIGDNSNLDRARSSLGILLDRRGRLRDGLVLKQKVLQSYRQREVVQGAVIAQENVALSLLHLGQPAEALRIFAEVAKRYAELGDRTGMAWAPYYQGRAWLERGELSLAEEHLDRARSEADKRLKADPSLAAAVDFERARLAWIRGDIQQARSLIVPVIAFYEGIGQPAEVAEAQLMLAALARQETRWQESETLATSALRHFEATAAKPYALAAQVELARLEISRSKLAEQAPPGDLVVPRELASCQGLAAGNAVEILSIALVAEITRVRCQLERSRPAIPQQAVSQLDAIIARAEQQQLFLLELRARLVKLQALSAVDMGRGEKELALLQERARERGFSARAFETLGQDLLGSDARLTPEGLL